MIEQGIHAFSGKRLLLLQGPIGPFFRRLARDLIQAGAQVHKVNFNGGDWLFYPDASNNFRERMEDWPAYFSALIDRLHIDTIILFGDCRPIHEAAHEIAHRRGIEIGVFEEGYIRPDFVTFERLGVNNHSRIPRFSEFYLANPVSINEPSIRVGITFWYAVMWAMLYYFMAGLLKPLFFYYRHHRPLTWLEALPWLRAAWRKGYYNFVEWDVLPKLTGELTKSFFLVPLQVHNDAQIHTHSEFDSVPHFIEVVMASFAQYAPLGAVIVIKHHPLDRGYHDYSKLIQEQAEKLNLHGRCFYIHDQHLPTLLQHACGVVVVNSTVGLSALHHATPLKVCGNAIYDMAGLTFQGTLNDFWKNNLYGKPDDFLLQSFHGYLMQYTQLNGSFYKRLSGTASSTGLRWIAKEK